MPGTAPRSPAAKRFRLPNGLQVILAPRPESPTASVWVWYRVGSKNEWPGVTGASHWVEHMLFQGSPKFGKGEIDQAIVEVGGTLNAFTDTDFTAYFSTVPKERLAIPLRIEADRMTRALLTDREVQRERTVIHSEREGNENWPEFRVDEELYQLAFRHHPYRWEPLGRKEDIRSLTPEALREYYHRFYGPKNAVLVVTGGYDRSSVERTVRSSFGRLPAVGADPVVKEVEPPLTGERRATLRGPGTTPLVAIGWRSPAVHDPATPATIVLDVVLGGETRLFSSGASWGRGGEHPSSRLYQALVDPALAVRAASEFRPRVHPSLFTVSAQAAAGVTLDRIEATIRKEVGRLARRGPTAEELADVRTKVRRGAELAYEGASRTGFRLGYFSMLGPAGYESTLLRRILAVDRAAARKRAAELFRPGHDVVVRYEPAGESDDRGP
ncbi:MAG: insulinase family protein [Thermoplasmata archaeon]|nr:insulinase family protein [Thermoplasmata archaeon]MCI4361932.1 insulinase family protein [Thermoplasmata archaeon]MCI4370397.1 insulinase family protein [Thermoplasmata archaeon]